MPRVSPRDHASTKARNAPPPPKKEVTARTRDGRVTKPYKVQKNSTIKEILEQDVKINRSKDWIKCTTSKLENAGEGAFADRLYQKGELIGRFRGAPVYELEIAGNSVCIFSIKSGEVCFAKNISHVIWSRQTTQQLEMPAAPNQETQTINLNFGIEVDGKMSKINH